MPDSSHPASRGLPRSRGDPLVEAELRRRIRARGRISFAEFMEVALYLPSAGYYQVHAEIGPQGDFLTSPETHPAFGALLARLCMLMWRTTGSPGQFGVIEYGAGTGSLCRQILEAVPLLSPGFAAALEYGIVEVSSALRARQQARLADLGDRVQWVQPREPTPPAAGCVLANEVVDALPVHRLRVVNGRVREIYVGLAADRYLELLGPVSRPELESRLRDAGVQPPEGSTLEINLAAREWLREASNRLKSGYMVIIDFGGSERDLYAGASRRGGLKCFYRHAWTDDPYDRPGWQDLTAPVDFTDLVRSGRELGLEVMAELSQRELLASLGLKAALSRLETMGLPVVERERNKKAMQALLDPAGLGGYRVLVQGEAAPPLTMVSACGGELQPLPLLPQERVDWPE